ncbi:MAG: recombinase family protein [Chloroflexi bacterium]|nr:recombinase family protein [Chloroflexota bacterium]
MTSLPDTRPRAAVYVRVSSRTQEEEGTSLVTQEAACRRYAAEHGYTVAEDQVYREVFTGVELWERSVLQRLREAIRRHDVDVAIVHAIDRLARDPVHLGVILTEADHAGVPVEFVSEPLDSSPEGQLIRFVRGYAAKVEHEKIKERTIRGRRARVEAGKLLPGARPLYGYRWRDDGKTAYDPDPATVPIVRRIWRQARDGMPLRAIAMGLDRDGVPTPTKNARGHWCYTTVRDILKNPMYAGRGVAFRRVRVKNGRPGRGSAKLRPEPEQVPLPAGTVPPLVDAPTFDAVQQRLRLNRQRSARNNRDPEGALLRGGYARCGDCGGVMIVKRATDPAGARRYRCDRGSSDRRDCGSKPSIMVPQLDGAVWTRVESILTQPEVVAAELERMEDNDPTRNDLAAADRALATLARQQSNLIDQIANVSGQAATLLTAKVEALERQREQLDAEREAMLGRHRTRVAARERLSDLETWCRTVAANLGNLKHQQKRDALDALGVQVKVHPRGAPHRFVIDANIPLDSFIVCSTSRSTATAT